MALEMSALSSEIVIKFREFCVWLHETWLCRKYLFDKNRDLSILQQPRNEHFFCKLHTILQEYWLIQLAKLHDPAVQNNRVNLTLDYIIDYGNWDAETLRELKQLQKTMTALNQPIRTARNKILCHNDLAVILDGGVLGEFPEGDDIKYFDALQSFVNIVCQKIMRESFEFDKLVLNDIEIFTHCFKAGLKAIDIS
jgi:hypothetical protein